MKTAREHARTISILCFSTIAYELQTPKRLNIMLFHTQGVKTRYTWSIPTALCFKPTSTVVLSSLFVKQKQSEGTVSRVRDGNENSNIGL
jgi:hypothetical protein